ncbi:MAG: PAS domain S-box protein [Actinomycetota bacterium]|nr:PAS domain S-box protein [Actinomycetota bacterium]
MVALAESPEARIPLRVLIVEDSEDDALLVMRELKRGGYEPIHERVQTAEAMQKALAGPSSLWDVIISDYHMPRFAAPEALRMWREAGSKAPFIVVSGKVGEEVAVEAMKAGAYDYVMKDNLTRLCTTVERGLEEAEERRERKRAQRELRRREAILRAVGFSAERFLSEVPGWEESIEEVLEQLGHATEASRVYVFENYAGEDGEVWGNMRYEWVDQGVSSQINNSLMQAIPYRAAGYGRWTELWERGELVYGHTREFPEGERPELEAQDILSIAIVPIFVDGRWWGQIGFDECFAEREWSAAEMDALRAAASTFGAAIQRRRTEEELRGSEELYRAVVEQAAENIFLVDVDTKWILRPNAAFQQLLGYTAEELRRTTLYDVVAHDRESIDRNTRRILAEGRYSVGERKYRRKDGSLVDAEINVSTISYGGRRVLCVVSRDITERKRAEEKLRASEAGLANAQRVAHLGNWEWDLVSNEAYWSDELYRIHGFAPQEFVPTWELFLSYVHPADREHIEKSFHQALHEREPYDVEHRILRPDGSERIVHCQLELAFDERGQAVRAVGTVHDVTERKKNEEALRQSEQLYRTVIEQAAENICLVDAETKRILESNPAFQRTLGYTEEELRRMTLYDFVAHDRESIDRNMRRALEQKRYFVGERKYRRKDGTLTDVEVSASTILLDDREALCIVAHDITERARVQGLLEERVATLSRIAAGLTLDLPAENTFDVLAESVVNASTAVACLVTLTGEKTEALYPAGSHDMPEGYTAGLEASYRAGVQSPTIEAFRKRRPMLVRDLRRIVLSNPLYAPIHHLVREVPWDILYIVPLISRGRALGAINLCYPPGREPGEDEKTFLGAVADQTAVAVENARLFAQARGKAALEERQRLARELHDSVSQALYGIALGAKTPRTLLERDPRQAADPLDYVLSLAEAGLAEMRALIFELRPESLEKEGLVAALEKQAAALRARHEIEVESVLCDEPGASSEAKETVYRIAQEALHNIVKHARASNVEIAMNCDPERIILQVSDDGVGFDAGEDFPGHLGLRSMRERASHLGGTLEVETEPGRGTRIQARIPI